MFLRGIAFIFAIWLGGFLAFNLKLMNPPTPTGKTDAIIALTGGEGRLEHAVEQLRRGKAKRMLITGVNRSTTKRDLRLRTNAPKKLFDCCVDLGFAAVDTIGNAVETSVWMEHHHFKSLRLVTSRAHMPRARLEFKNSLPNIKIVADANQSDSSFANQIGEYNKYAARLILLRAKQL